MEKYYYFSSRKADAPRLLSLFSEKLQNRGYDNFPLGNSLSGERWNASIESTDFGCNGRFYIWSKDDEENSVENFRELDTFFQAFIQCEVNIGNIWARGFAKQKDGDKEISRDATNDDTTQKHKAYRDIELTYIKKKSLSDEAFTILEVARGKSSEALKDMCNKTIGFLAKKLSDDSEYVLAVFGKEYEKLKIKNKDEPLEKIPISDFIAYENLEAELRKRRKKSKNNL